MDLPGSALETPRPRVIDWVRARVRGALTFAMLCAAIVVFGATVNRHYPIQKWLFWHYAGYWLALSVIGVGAYGLGHVLLRNVLRLRLQLAEHAVLSFGAGIYGYKLLMFLIGALQGYRTPTFFILPLGLLAAVSVPLVRHLRHVRRVLARSARTRPRLDTLAMIALAFGMVGLGLVYFNIITPQNIQFDSRWKHMALAEDYVVNGGIHRHAEGFVFSARPHFTSYLYAWAFLLPGARLFDRMELAAHLEFGIFLFTTVFGIPALVKRLVPRVDTRWIWAARFLFPGVWLYDSSVSGGADHVGAMYCVPAALCLFRVLRDLDLRFTALLGLFLAGASMTKETVAMMSLPFPVLAVFVRAGIDAVRAIRKKLPEERRRRFYLAPLVLGAAGIVFTAPLWLKNFVLYGDPFYPLLNKWLTLHPLSEDAAYRLKHGYLEGKLWAPTRDLAGIKQTFKALAVHSFIPNDWKRFHRDVPVFGSLFTLSLLCLPFLKGTKRIWLLVGWIHVALFTWYSVHHQDRYLQGLLPLMAAATAGTFLLTYRSFGPLVRVPLLGLMGLQVIWGGDVFFIQTHAHTKSPAKDVIDLLSSGYEKKYEERFAIQKQWQDVGAAVPKDGKLLIHLFHEHHAHLGTGRRTVLDNYLWQFGIEYGRAGSPEGVRRLLADIGVTHAYFSPDKKSDGVNSIAADILFWDFAAHHLLERKGISGGVLGRLPDKPITARFWDTAVILGCDKYSPPAGLYRVKDLHVLPFGPDVAQFPAPERPAATKQEAEAMINAAEFVVLPTGCYPKDKPAELSRGFEQIVDRRKAGVWREMLIYVRRGEAMPPAFPNPNAQ